jgi:hypothetical protein
MILTQVRMSHRTTFQTIYNKIRIDMNNNEASSSSRNGLSTALMVLGALLAIGLVLGAYILGSQTKSIGSGRSTVSVKGLAEKPVKADFAEWHVAVQSLDATFAGALNKLRQERGALDQFLDKQGFEKSSRRDETESVEPNYVEKQVKGNTIRVQEGFIATQIITINTKSLEKVTAAYKVALDYKASGHDIKYTSPNYLVSSLEEVKMSLISTATDNAKKRAQEFIKNSDAKLGNMRSAAQGAFYILPNTADAKTDEYGGTYDKSTIDKIARVVVTVEFNLK